MNSTDDVTDNGRVLSARIGQSATPIGACYSFKIVQKRTWLPALQKIAVLNAQRDFHSTAGYCKAKSGFANTIMNCSHFSLTQTQSVRTWFNVIVTLTPNPKNQLNRAMASVGLIS